LNFEILHDFSIVISAKKIYQVSDFFAHEIFEDPAELLLLVKKTRYVKNRPNFANKFTFSGDL